MFFFLNRSELVVLSVSYAGKKTYSAGKTGEVFRGDASGANRGYVLAQCGGGQVLAVTIFELSLRYCLFI